MSKVDYRGDKDLEDEKELSLQEIIGALIDGEKDLELKTRINEPRDLAGVDLYANHLSDNKCPNSSKRIIAYVKIYLRYQVSYKGRSREEIVRSIIGFLDRDLPNKTPLQQMR